MLLHIIRKEFRETVRDGRFVWTGAIIAALLLVALLIGWMRFDEARELRNSAAEQTRQQFVDQGVKNPHAAAHYGMYAFKPTTFLSLFDQGVNAYTGNVSLLEAHRQNEFKYKEAQDSTALQRFGDLSAAMIFQLLIPLLIILLTFSAISGEREEGTLRQVLSLGVGRQKLLWGKALGVALTLTVTLAPATIIGAAAIILLSSTEYVDPHLLLDMPVKVAALGAAYLAYFWIFIALSIVVSTVTRSSRAALTILLGFWIINGLLLPRAASDLSRQLFPTPSAFDFARISSEERSKGPQPHNSGHPNYIAFRDSVLKQYGVKRVEDLPVNFYGLSLQADEEHGYKVYDRLYGDLWSKFEQQAQLQQKLGFVSPHLAIRSLSMAIAGTDFSLHRDFATAAENYRRSIQRAMNEQIQKGAAGQSSFSADWEYTAGPEVWARTKPFDYDPPRLNSVLAGQTTAVVVLALWLIVALGAITFASRRMRVDA
jgi:ABC-2 type transport system permease protein